MTTVETLEAIVKAMKEEIDELQEKMKLYETEAKSNNLLLHSVKQQVDSLVAIGKWILVTVGGLLASVIGGVIVYLITSGLGK